jgi:hypothetical protein
MPPTPTSTLCSQSCGPNKVIWAHILKVHVRHFLDEFTCHLLVLFSPFIKLGPSTYMLLYSFSSFASVPADGLSTFQIANIIGLDIESNKKYKSTV